MENEWIRLLVMAVGLLIVWTLLHMLFERRK